MNKDWKISKGEPITAEWASWVNEQLRGLNIKAGSGISINKSRDGLVIRNTRDETSEGEEADEVIPTTYLGYANRKTGDGTYTSIQTWTSATDFVDSQDVMWPFNLGTLTYGGSSTTWPTNPYSTVFYTEDTDDDKWIWALNLSRHYIPQGAIVPIFKEQDLYYCDWRMPATLIGTLDDDLVTSSLVTLTSGQLYSGKILAYNYFGPEDDVIEAGTAVVCNLREGSIYNRYYVSNVSSCPVEAS